MATLTNSWQSLGSATLYSGITIHLDGKYTSQSVNNNTTTVQFRLRSTGNQWRTSSGTAKFTGAFTDSASCATYPSYITDGTTVFSITKTVTHNTDGTKSLSIGGQISANLGAIYTATIYNTSVTLPKINRLATILTAEDFTDEGNPTITFNNPSNFTVKPYLNFYDRTGSLVYSLVRDESITSPYTWEISSAERSAIRSATNQQASYTVNVGVDTYNGGTKLGYNSVPKTMTYINATPTQTIAVEETNAKVISVLGNDSSGTYAIQNASSLHFTSTPTALKSATINNVSLYQDGVLQQTITTSPYSFNNVTVRTDTFNIIATDSRGLSLNTEKKYTTTYIEYLPIDITTFSFVRQTPTSANIILNAEITYKQATFKNTANVPTIKWKVGESGTLNTISLSSYTIDTANNKITITNLILTNALAYNASDTLYLYASDLLTEDSDQATVTKGFPTFEAGEHDFQINGDLYIADQNRNNIKKVNDLFPTALFTSTNGENGTVNLSDDSANYSKLIIYYKIPDYGNVCGSQIIYDPDGKIVHLTATHPNSANSRLYILGTNLSISGNKITVSDSYGWAIQSSGYSIGPSNRFYIIKVEGIK